LDTCKIFFGRVTGLTFNEDIIIRYQMNKAGVGKRSRRKEKEKKGHFRKR
jgi:hypothetical protein